MCESASSVWRLVTTIQMMGATKKSSSRVAPIPKSQLPTRGDRWMSERRGFSSSQVARGWAIASGTFSNLSVLRPLAAAASASSSTRTGPLRRRRTWKARSRKLHRTMSPNRTTVTVEP